MECKYQAWGVRPDDTQPTGCQTQGWRGKGKGIAPGVARSEAEAEPEVAVVGSLRLCITVWLASVDDAGSVTIVSVER